MKRINLLSVALILCAFASAQPSYNWGFGIGSTGNNEYARCVVSDTAGNSYVTGNITGTVDIDPGASVQNLVPGGSNDAYLAKYDPSGNLIWAFNYGGTYAYGRDLEQDTSKNIYLCGSYFGTVDFDPGTGVDTATTFSTGAFVAKYDASGNYSFVIRIAGTGNVQGLEMSLDNSGNIFVTGTFQGTTDFDPGPGVQNRTAVGNSDAFVAKYDASGNYVFAFGLGNTGNESGHSIAADPSGNVVVVGSFRNTIDFDPGPGTANRTSAGFEDGFVAKYDPSGNFIWAFDLGSTTSDCNYMNVDIDQSGNIYIGSNFTGWVDFDPGPPNQSIGASSGAAFVAKYSPTGAYQWAFSIDAASQADWIHGLYLDNAANIYITGGFVATADFDPSASVALLNGSGAGVFLASYDASGNYRWATNFGGSNTRGEEISADPKGGVFVVGRYGGTMDLDGGPGTQNITAAGGLDGFFTKYSGCTSAPAQPATLTGPDTVCQGSTHTYYATNDPSATSYTWTLPGGWTGTSTVDSIVATASATSGTISVTANNACGSSTAQTLNVTVNPIPGTPVITASGSTTICSGDSVVLTSSASAGNQWHLNGSPIPGAVNQTYAATASGNYTVIVTLGGCGSATSSVITVTVNTLPTVSLSAYSPDTICSSTPAFPVPSGTPTGGTYSGTGVSGGNFDPSQSGTGSFYTVYTYTDGNNCTNVDSTMITVEVCTGMDGVTVNALMKVYPNPTTDVVNVILVNQAPTGQISMLDPLGKLVFEQSVVAPRLSIDVSGFAKGVYLLRLQTGEIITYEKVIVE